MKKIVLLFGICTLSFYFSTKAQTIDVQWTEPIKCTNKTGHFSEIVGENANYFYVILNNYFFRSSQEKMIKIISYSKETMQKVSERLIYNAKADFDDEVKCPYYQTIVYENTICIFWLTVNKGGEREMYVNSFDSQLNPLKEKTKIYTGQTDTKKDKRQFYAFPNSSTNQLVVGQLSLSGENEFSINYSLLDIKDFSTISSNKCKLPIKDGEQLEDFYNVDYGLGDDGNLHLKYLVNFKKEERTALKKGASKTYTTYAIANLSNGAVKSIPFHFSDKNVFDFGHIENKDSIKFFGLYNDLNVSKKKRKTNGVFYFSMNAKNLESSNNFKFIEFTKEQLGEDGDFEYTIERVGSTDSSIFLFCTKSNNGSQSSSYTNSAGMTTNHYSTYCQKTDISIIKITADTVQWISTINRSVTYNGSFNVKDIDVKRSDGVFYVMYGNYKSHPCAIVDAKTGTYETKSYTFPDELHKKKLRNNRRVNFKNGSCYVYTIIDMAPWTHNKEIMLLGKVNYK